VASRWHELGLKGPEKVVRAFVAGFTAGHGGGPAIFMTDVDIDTESLTERLRELFAAGSHHGLLAPEAFAEALAVAVKEEGAEAGIHLERRRVIEAASFPFRVEAYARDVARQLRGALVEALPDGVGVEDLVETEEKNPEARGAELYAPLHEFVYRASGRVRGPLAGVLEVWRRARGHDFAEVGPLALAGRELAT
jgi:hypothetical protein